MRTAPMMRTDLQSTRSTSWRRWIHQMSQRVIEETNVTHLNPYRGVNPSAKTKVASERFWTQENKGKIDELIIEEYASSVALHINRRTARRTPSLSRAFLRRPCFQKCGTARHDDGRGKRSGVFLVALQEVAMPHLVATIYTTTSIKSFAIPPASRPDADRPCRTNPAIPHT